MINLIAVGKIKDNNLKALIDRYSKLISHYHPINIIEVKDISDSNDQQIKLEEQLILKQIKERDFVITLDIEGSSFDSVQFSEKLFTTFLNGYSNITFVIGGSNGLGDLVKKRANLSWSFSKLTFPHQLFRLILLEQIYRSFTINKNTPYHK